eukprot:Gregarina_sp_Poly_1__3715@NODE_209_length_11372_cov_428_789120_g186_i0_p6_GENE_NODE_209_length_11372_cov_428_789120_g186_i0NODE_209_length_11372_cov_428_789120_g186_i0_p6_ORF_typecomplete_len357_score39_02Exostosin/PF03016_15/0_00024_NODE_209_length_11372_cov_428_789120_g186_i049075977
MMQSSEWRRFNGSNFFTFWPDWPISLWARRRDSAEFASIGASVPKPLSAWKYVTRQLGGFNYQTPAEARQCMISSQLDIHDEFKANRYWPEGELESYKFPTGNYAQMKLNRRHSLFFVSSIDSRPAYRRRWDTLIAMANFSKPSYVAHKIKHAFAPPRKFEGPQCSNSVTQGCQLAESMGSTHLFAEWAVDSIFGLHVRGDDWYSSRLGEVLASAGVLVVVEPETWTFTMGDTCHIPFRDIVVTISDPLFWEDPRRALESALAELTHEEVEKKLRLLEYYRQDIFFGILGSRCAHNHLTEYAQFCLSADVLGHFGIAKADNRCYFEHWNSLTPFPIENNEDDVSPWGEHWWRKLKP